MEIRIKNLGNIKKANIKLKNLTIFVGENNTNKTWTAYLTYAITAEIMLNSYLKNILTRRRDSKLKRKFIKLHFLIKDAIIESEKGKDYEEIVLKNMENADFEFETFFKEFVKDYTKFIKNNLPEFMSLSKDILKNFSFNLILDKKEIKNIKERFLKSLNRNFFNTQNPEILYFSEFSEIFSNFMKISFGEPFNIPSERKALIQFSSIIALGERNLDQLKNALFEESFKKLKTENDISLSKLFEIHKYISGFKYNYPIPIIDFKDFVTKLNVYREKDNLLNKELLKLFEISILEGNIAIDQTGKIKYMFKENHKLDLSVSSSMVKSLSGLDVYLRYKASKGDLLIIDEPEMNLHPEAQVKLIEFLSILANNGIKVLITTHSPYIVDHLVNLIEGYESKKEHKEKLFWEPKYINSGNYEEIKASDIFISKENISVYFFKKNGEVENILDKENISINWETFSQISEKVSNLYWEL